MSRTENAKRAKNVIAERRAASINTYEAHVSEASFAIPGFSEVNSQIASTGAKIMASVLSKGEGAVTIDTIRQEYDQLVLHRRDLLVSHGYPADYCDIKYHCSKCSDTGYVGIYLCDCLRRELVTAAFESSGLCSLVNNQTFDTFLLDFYQNDDRKVMTQNVRILRDFASGYSKSTYENFLFLGATGLGKTHLSSAVARSIIEKGGYVVYESSITLFADYEAKRFGNSYYSDYDSNIEKYTECDLLIIDDLGCELTNQFTVSCLYSIINTRMINKKSTIISTNFTFDELKKKYSDRIVSRIFGEYKPLIFRGTDIREQKIRKNLGNF